MSIAGPLFVVGQALFFAGLYRALTGARLFDTHEDWALVALGAAMMGGAYELWSHGVA